MDQGGGRATPALRKRTALQLSPARIGGRTRCVVGLHAEASSRSRPPPVRPWQLPASIKFTLVCVVITAFLLWSYQTLVRYRWLGTFFNGPRQPATKAADLATD